MKSSGCTEFSKRYKRKLFIRKVTAAIFPERCPYCDKVILPARACCPECYENFPDIIYERMAFGGYPTVSPFAYINSYRNAIRRFKFDGIVQFAPQMAEIMAEAAKRAFNGEEFDVITFVPLHPDKEKERGFNQSKLLAKELSLLLQIPCEDLLIKTRNNLPQHKTDARDRKKNVLGVYKLCANKQTENQRILIVDDIITTGHTLGECARILSESGASKICCVTFATAVVKTT